MSFGPAIRGLTVIGALFGFTSAHAEGVTLRAVTFAFPTDDAAFPPGPGGELVTSNCTGCHSAGMMLTQPTLNKATWLAEVNKMRTAYKAPVADEDVEPIAAYLAALPVAK